MSTPGCDVMCVVTNMLHFYCAIILFLMRLSFVRDERSRNSKSRVQLKQQHMGSTSERNMETQQNDEVNMNN